jgi:hypothetical protein
MKCRYQQCKFNGEVDKKDAIQINNTYYHKACYEEKKDKEQIRSLFLEKINPNENKMLLNKSINQLVHDKNYDSKYIVYALEYAIKYNIKLSNAFGLHWLVTDEKIKKQYDEIILNKKILQVKDKMRNIEVINNDTDFNFKPNKKPSWIEIDSRIKG